MTRSLVPYYFYILGTVLCTIYGQLILKWRIVRYGQLPDGLAEKLTFLFKALVDPFIFSGLVAAFLASLFWMAAVTRLDLSSAYPLITAGLTTITVILSIVLLKEPLSFSKVLGVLLIVSGVLVMIKDTA
jgi:multidrug transporter EmrE-like cation transporter